MRRKDWVNEIRPCIEGIIALLLYLRFGGFTTEPTISQCFVAATIFTTEFEKKINFID